MNSRDTFSKSPVVMTVTDLPWNRVSLPTPDLNSSSLQELLATEPKEPEKEKENRSEDALSVLTSKTCQSLLSRREKNKSRASLILPFQEDLVPRELTISESSMVLKEEKKINQLPLLWSRRTSPEELSRAKRIPLLHWDKRLLRSKDWSLTLD